MIEKLKPLKNLAIIFVLWGIVTFPLFIFEESQQTIMFGTWQAIDTCDWKTVKQGHDLGVKINQTMKTVNKWFGWIHPFSFMSYNAYGKASDYYWFTLKAKVLKNDPTLYEGEEVREQPMIPDRFEFNGHDIYAVKGPVRFSVETAEVREYLVSGVYKVRGGILYIE